MVWITMRFLSAVWTHSDGTHSLQRWASDVMLNFPKQTRLHLGWPEAGFPGNGCNVSHHHQLSSTPAAHMSAPESRVLLSGCRCVTVASAQNMNTPRAGDAVSPGQPSVQALTWPVWCLNSDEDSMNGASGELDVVHAVFWDGADLRITYLKSKVCIYASLNTSKYTH